MSKYDAAFSLSGDAALESPAMERIDDLRPLFLYQFGAHFPDRSRSVVFPDPNFGASNSFASQQNSIRLAEYFQRISGSWPFVRHMIRVRAYFECAPDDFETLTLYPQVQSAAERVYIPSQRFQFNQGPNDWNFWDDWQLVNYGPRGVQAFDRIFIFWAVRGAINPNIGLGSWFIIWPQFPNIRPQANQSDDYTTRWPFVGGRLDPSAAVQGVGIELHYMFRNVAQIKNDNSPLDPPYQTDEQRMVVTVYEPTRAETWQPTQIIELPPFG